MSLAYPDVRNRTSGYCNGNNIAQPSGHKKSGIQLQVFKVIELLQVEQNIMHKTRDFKDSQYIKTIGIKLEKFELIEKIRNRKSRAGKLDEIIEFYIKEKKYDKM